MECGQTVAASHRVGVVWPQGLLANLQRPLIQRLGLRIFALRAVEFVLGNPSEDESVNRLWETDLRKAGLK
jgi:hypothetical protein